MQSGFAIFFVKILHCKIFKDFKHTLIKVRTSNTTKEGKQNFKSFYLVYIFCIQIVGILSLYFNFSLNTCMRATISNFLPYLVKYLCINNVEKSINMFLSIMLLVVRCGKRLTANTSWIFPVSTRKSFFMQIKLFVNKTWISGLSEIKFSVLTTDIHFICKRYSELFLRRSSLTKHC